MEKLINSNKFDNNGAIKFEGLTTIVFVTENIKFELAKIQESVFQDFKQSSIPNNLHFVAPESFHMTICDIEPSEDFQQSKTNIDSNIFYKRLDHLKSAFNTMKSGFNDYKIDVKITDLRVRKKVVSMNIESDPDEHNKILKIENIIKDKSSVDLRKFKGHITLGYLHVIENDKMLLEKIEVLCNNNAPKYISLLTDTKFGFNFIDYCYFYDMNNYLTILKYDVKTKMLCETEFCDYKKLEYNINKIQPEHKCRRFVE